jgi:hypothetical protein
MVKRYCEEGEEESLFSCQTSFGFINYEGMFLHKLWGEEERPRGGFSSWFCQL